MVHVAEVNYEALTPRERVPRIYAAGKRGNKAEQDRLAKSAPRVSWDIPDFQGLSEALAEMPAFFLATLLHLCCQFWRMSGLHTREWAQEELDGPEGEAALKDPKGADLRGPDRQQLFEAERLAAYTLIVHLDALKLLSDEFGVDLADDIARFPEWQTVEDTERAARLLAFSQDEAAACLQARGQSGAVATVESVAAGLRAYIAQRSQRWA
jgi:hypothetical protein